ncbi:MAG: 5-(carboxyamino)imidazole ribonucleotide synthase, partial [Gemmatimonadaceae bacterium]
FNIIGKQPDIGRVLAVPDAHLHLYGKSERPDRKLGHITVRTRTLRERLERVAAVGAVTPTM